MFSASEISFGMALLYLQKMNFGNLNLNSLLENKQKSFF